MNPADERIEELLDKWLASLELHLKYVALDEPDYRKAQPWPEHDRPSRWIIEVAKGKARELRDQVAARIAAGDATFCESLELMAFLVNLVGARVDRFIPLAEVASEVDVSTAKQPAVAPPAAAAAAAPRAVVANSTPAPSPPTPPPPPPAAPAAPIVVAAPAPRATPAAAPSPAPSQQQPRPEQQYAPPPAPVFKTPPPVSTPAPAPAPPSTPIGPARTVPAIGAAPVVLVAPTLPSAPPAPVIPPPLAPPVTQSPPPAAPARAAPAPRPPPATETTTAARLTASGEQRALAAAMDATREMPRPVLGGAEHPSGPDDTVETPRAKTDARKVTRRETKARAPAERAPPSRESHGREKDMSATVIADAVRLIVWGRKWHELVELIGRFAERPSATEIRRILKEHRASIEKTAEKERSKKKK